ncbi:MAG: Arm DNA-binding domain-containing protein [Bacteroidales bacterium]
MKTTNTSGILFYLRKYKRKDGNAPIYVRITVDGKRTDVSLKKDIFTANWNDVKGLVKGKAVEIRNLNTYLEQIRSRLVECYQERQSQKKLKTADLIKYKLCGAEEKDDSLILLFDYHNKREFGIRN